MERPILFSTPMVQSILDGRKTQTRRIIKKQPHGAGEWIMRGINWLFPNVNPYINLKCPYGQISDVLWVRETFFDAGGYFIYKANCPEDYEIVKWKPSIFMPKEACRIKLLIKDIRVERLQDISEKDAIAEGIEMNNKPHTGWYWMKDVYSTDYAPLAYEKLWNKINGKDSWSKNPWVWVIEFNKL
jgi:hypothetical protein